MNLHASFPDRAETLAFAVAEQRIRSAPLAAFARRAAKPARDEARAFGIVGVLLVHGLALLSYFLAGPNLVTRSVEQVITVVDVPPELPKEPEPPPPPKFAPPPRYVPQLIAPEVELVIPPVPRETITISKAPPTAVSPAAPISSAPPAISGTTKAAFAARLFAHLNRFKRYPEAARLRRQEGIVSLRFTMDRTGRVLSFEVAKSSGVSALDDAARDLIQRAQPLPAIPPEFGRDRLELVVPIEYLLH